MLCNPRVNFPNSTIPTSTRPLKYLTSYTCVCSRPIILWKFMKVGHRHMAKITIYLIMWVQTLSHMETCIPPCDDSWPSWYCKKTDSASMQRAHSLLLAKLKLYNVHPPQVCYHPPRMRICCNRFELKLLCYFFAVLQLLHFRHASLLGFHKITSFLLSSYWLLYLLHLESNFAFPHLSH